MWEKFHTPQTHHCKSDTQKSWAMFCFPKIFQTPVSMFLPFINDIHTLGGAGSFQFGIKNTTWKISSGWFFFSIRNLSTNICHFCLKKCIFQFSGLATKSLAVAMCLPPSFWSCWILSQWRKLLFVQHDRKPKHCTRLLFSDFPQLRSGTYNNRVLRKKKRQIRHAESDQCSTSSFRGTAIFWLLEGWWSRAKLMPGDWIVRKPKYVPRNSLPAPNLENKAFLEMSWQKRDLGRWCWICLQNCWREVHDALFNMDLADGGAYRQQIRISLYLSSLSWLRRQQMP